MSKVILIASVCHALNAALCAAIGDISQPSWEDAPDWQKQSAIAGVEMHMANPDATPEQSHESWMAQKVAEGWTCGEVKDPEKKEHPCMRPYAELPEIQKAKDHVFRAAVHALKDLPLEQVQQTAAASSPSIVQVTADGFTPVKYIGHRDTYRDGAYGTGIVWARGETKPVPSAKAAMMLRHKDVYALGQAEVSAPLPAVKDKTGQSAEQVEEELQAQRDAVALMDKNSLKAYAQTNFRIDLDGRRSVADLRAQVTQLIDQYGVTQ